MLAYLLYVSSAVHPMSDDELLDILTVSRRNNAPQGVTGILLYKGGNFIQLLEGSKGAVTTLHQKIIRDPRHVQVRTLLTGTLPERQFGDWEMGFTHLDQLPAKDVPGLSDFLLKPFDPDEFLDSPSRAFRFLLNFKDLMHG